MKQPLKRLARCLTFKKLLHQLSLQQWLFIDLDRKINNRIDDNNAGYLMDDNSIFQYVHRFAG